MILAITAIFIISARGQGFLNLNFESAQNLPGNPPIPDGVQVAAANALPDWAAYNGPNSLAFINYVSNYISGVSTSVTLEGGSLALSGNLSVELFSGGSISQTGMVPESAESLQFEARGPGPGDSIPQAAGFSVTLGGQTLSYSAFSEGSGYTIYGADIPADMNGQMEALTFLIQGGESGQVQLDNIEFSSMSVPEPSASAFLGLGAILVGLRRCRKPL